MPNLDKQIKKFMRSQTLNGRIKLKYQVCHMKHLSKTIWQINGLIAVLVQQINFLIRILVTLQVPLHPLFTVHLKQTDQRRVAGRKFTMKKDNRRNGLFIDDWFEHRRITICWHTALTAVLNWRAILLNWFIIEMMIAAVMLWFINDFTSNRNYVETSC